MSEPLTITCLNGEIVETKMIRQHRDGRLCYNGTTGIFYVVDNDKDVEIDMDIVELVLHQKKWSFV